MATKAPTARDIGIDAPAPKRACDDRHCPFHGTLPVRGQTFEGTVLSTRMQRTAVIERQHLRYILKFERYEKRTKRFYVHSPPCLDLDVRGHGPLDADAADRRDRAAAPPLHPEVRAVREADEALLRAQPPVPRSEGGGPGRPDGVPADLEDRLVRRDPEQGGGRVKGLPGRQTRGLPKGARLECIDNTGAKNVEIIEGLKYRRVPKRIPPPR